MADKIVVNSDFTSKFYTLVWWSGFNIKCIFLSITEGVFKETFKSLRIVPDILYPSINSNLFDDLSTSKQPVKLDIPDAKHLFVSINRFEPKKNIALAIRTLSKLIDN